MKLLNENQILDVKFRKEVIKFIKSEANKARKTESIKRFDIFRDNTIKWVMARLKNEIKNPDTLALMSNRASNISIGKKIINKLARVYSDKVIRTTGNEKTDKQVSDLESLLNFTKMQKRADRYEYLARNCMPWFYPELASNNKFRISMKVLAPHQFDVLESANNCEEAGCVILSDYRDSVLSHLPTSNSLPSTTLDTQQAAEGFKKDDELFIFWTENYHFTTNSKGEYVGIGSITPEDLLNPIKKIPGVTVSSDQDGGYWATGGGDIVDGSILINTLLTDMNAIAYMQGWGQLVITGTKVPDEFTVGPLHALVLTYDKAKDEGEPKVTAVSTNPPLESWMRMVEQFTALLLSTNNLSPKTVTSKLELSNLASGIAQLVDKSESTESVEERQGDFYWIENKEWDLVKRWHNLYHSKKLLIDEFQNIGALPENLYVTPRFTPKAAEVITESERLDNMKKRYDLGIATKLDLIMQDQPGLTKEEAQKRLEELKKEIDKAASDASDVINDKDKEDEN